MPKGAIARFGTVRLRHGTMVLSVAFSPDGAKIASADSAPPNPAVRVWDASSGRLLVSVEGQASTNSLAFSPDGTKFAAPAPDNSTIRIWDASSGKELLRLRADSPDEIRKRRAERDRRTRELGPQELRGVDVREAMRKLGPFPSASPGFSTVAFSPDGRFVAAASRDLIIYVWDVTSGARRLRLEGHEVLVAKGVAHRSIHSVTFSPDASLLASVGADRTLRFWHLTAGRASTWTRLEEAGTPACIAFSRDGKSLAGGCWDGNVRFWEVPSGRLERTIRAHEKYVWSLAYTAAGDKVVSVGHKPSINLWGEADGRTVLRLDMGSEVPRSAAISPDEGLIAVGTQNGSVRLWDARSGTEVVRAGGHLGGINSVAVSPDGGTVATGADDGSIRLWDPATGAEKRKLRARDRPQTFCLAFSPDGRLLASGHYGEAYLWDTRTWTEQRRIEFSESVHAVAFSPDGATLALSGWGGVIQLWDVAAGRELRSFGAKDKAVLSVAFSPDGRTLASGGDRDAIRIWDVATGRELRTLEGEWLPRNYKFSGRTVGDAVWSVAFSPDGRHLATACGDGTVRIWDARTGAEIRRRPEKLDARAVAFSPDGKTLAIGCMHDSAVCLWDLKVGGALLKLSGHSGRVSSVAFDPGGRFLVSASHDKAALVWDLPKINDSSPDQE